MGRTPCCWTAGIKKGPWTPKEDQILRSFIEKHGHGNWRALPKHAGLLRCGKSCRLRWTNYLRPDVKRGNFTKDEEDTIIKLHATLGNKWSAIAAQLPGRTDNEIKNIWHTRLKKKACLDMTQPQPYDHDISCSSQKQSQGPSDSRSPPPPGFKVESSTAKVDDHPLFPHQYSHPGTYSDLNMESIGAEVNLVDSLESFFELDTSFWLDQISDSILTDASEFASYGGDTPKVLDVVDPFTTVNCDQTGLWNGEDPDNMTFNDELDFWFDLFVHSEEFEQL